MLIQNEKFITIFLPEDKIIKYHFHNINRINIESIVATIHLIEDYLFIEMIDKIILELTEYVKTLMSIPFEIKSNVKKPKILTSKGLPSKSKNKVDVKVYLDFSKIINSITGNIFSGTLSMKPYLTAYNRSFCDGQPIEYYLHLKVIDIVIN